MKHEDLLTDQDRADLERVERLIVDGEDLLKQAAKLRKRVMQRLRGRAFRRSKAVYSRS